MYSCFLVFIFYFIFYIEYQHSGGKGNIRISYKNIIISEKKTCFTKKKYVIFFVEIVAFCGHLCQPSKPLSVDGQLRNNALSMAV